MKLTPREKDKLLISVAAMVARSRLSRGIKLNYPEAVALITDYVVEGARDGRSVADLMEAGAHIVAKQFLRQHHVDDDLGYFVGVGGMLCTPVIRVCPTSTITVSTDQY